MGGVVVGEPSDFHVQLAQFWVVLSQLMQDEYGETPLFAACQEGHYNPAALLIDHGADVNYLRKVRPSHVRGQHSRMVYMLSLEQCGASVYDYVHSHHSVCVINAIVVGST